jgi:hypothetical protein
MQLILNTVYFLHDRSIITGLVVAPPVIHVIVTVSGLYSRHVTWKWASVSVRRALWVVAATAAPQSSLK